MGETGGIGSSKFGGNRNNNHMFDLFELVQSECYQLVELALDNLGIYGFEINSGNKDGNGLLHLAVLKDNLDLVQKIIKLGGDPNLRNKRKETPLHLAHFTGNLSAAKILIKHGALTNIKDIEGEVPLFKAARSGHLGFIKYFTAKTPPPAAGDGNLLTEVNSQRRSLLHIAAGRGDLDLLKFLLKTGEFRNNNNNSINRACADGSTALHDAIRAGNKKGGEAAVKLLLKKGGNVAIKDGTGGGGRTGRSPLHLAVAEDNLAIAKLLIDFGADVNCQDYNGETPLHYAADLHLARIAILLLCSKADVEKADLDGYTPLHVACGAAATTIATSKKTNFAKANREILTLLLTNKANANAKTLNGDTPLHLAASAGNCDAVTALMMAMKNQRALTTMMNKDNYTPVQLAKMNGGGDGSVEKILQGYHRGGGGFQQEQQESRPHQLPTFYGSRSRSTTKADDGSSSNKAKLRRSRSRSKDDVSGGRGVGVGAADFNLLSAKKSSSATKVPVIVQAKTNLAVQI